MLALAAICLAPPVAAQTQYSISPSSIASGTLNVPFSSVQFSVLGTPPPPSISWSWAPFSVDPLPPGMNFTAGIGGGLLSGTPTRGGTFSFVVSAVNGSTGAPLASALIVFAVSTPALSVTTPSTLFVALGSTVQLAATGGSPFQSPAPPYTWTPSFTPPPGLTISSSGLVTPTLSGTYSFGVNVADNSYPTPQSSSGFFFITIDPPISIAPTSPPSGVVNTPYSQTLTASGGFLTTSPVAGSFTWAVVAGSLPPGLTLTPTGARTASIAGTPTGTGNFTFTVGATDNRPTQRTQAMSISIAGPPFVITTAAVPNGQVGSFYSTTFASAGGTAPVTWTLNTGTLPPGLTLASNGVLNGTPTTIGVYSFNVRATDSGPQVQLTATAGFTVTVSPPPVVVTTTTVPAGEVGLAYTATFGATGGATPLTWTLNTGTLPPGLTLAANGVLSGSPTTSGTYNFSVKASDSSSPVPLTGIASFTVNVSPQLTIITSSLPNTIVGQSYSQSVAASGGSGTLAWTLQAGSLPAGITLAGNGGLSGAAISAGTYNFTLRVTDGLGALVNRAFTIVAASLLSINASPSSPLPVAPPNTPYSQTFTATGGTTPYTWSALGQPPGLTMSSGGVLSGTPIVPGTYNFTVQVSDASVAVPQTTNRTYSLTVNTPITITTASPLPGGVQSVPPTPYSQTLSATGGTPPFTWAVSLGAPPNGLTLSAAGVLSGNPTAAGTFTFTAQATDSLGLPQTKSFTVTVAPQLLVSPATLPLAITGNAYSQPALTATGGTPPYSWSLATGTLPAGVTLSSGGVIGGTPSTAGTFNFTVQATDSGVGAGQQTATRALALTVDSLVIITNPFTLPQGATTKPYSLTFTATGGSTPLAWNLSAGAFPQGLTLVSNVLSGTPTAAGPHSFTMAVTDALGQVVTKTFSLNVVSPVVVSTSPAPPVAPPGAAYSFTFTATGGTTPYVWSAASTPPGLTLNSAGVLSGIPSGGGSYTFTVQVSDSSPTPQTATATFTLVEAPSVSISTTSIPSTLAGAAYSTTFAATGGTQPFTFALQSAPPSGLTFTPSSGTLAGAVASPGTYPLTVTVTDFYGVQASRSFTLTAVAQLFVTTSGLPPAHAGQPYSQQFTATGGGSGTYTWAAGGPLPPGLALSSSGLLSGTPTVNGNYTIDVRVSDPAVIQQTATASYPLLVFTALSIATPSPLLPGATLAFYSQQFSAVGGTPAYSWQQTGGTLPPGLTLTTAGLLSGTPGTPGVYTFGVTVVDAQDVSANGSFTITIVQALSITTASPLPAGNQGAAYAPVTLAATGGTPPYAWSQTGGALPTGMTLSQTGVISGTPASSGAFTFTVRATDSGSGSPQTASATFSLTINSSITITTSSPLAGGVAGQNYSAAFAAAGGVPPYTFTVPGSVGGTLPVGWTLAPAGALTGTTASPGTYTFTVQAADAQGGIGTKAFTVVVAAALDITTTSLPPAVLGTGYSQTLAATGGTGALTWTLFSGVLPTGITLTPGGVIGGTPSAAGTFNFTVRVVDSAVGTPQQDTQAITLVVNSPLVITTASPLPNARAGQAYSTSLAATGGTPALTWTVSGGALPATFSLSPAGVLTGNPSAGASGTSSFTVQVQDSLGQTQSRLFSLTIVAPLSISAAPLPPLGLVGTAYTFAFTASGGTAPYTWSLASGALPGGLNLTPSGQVGGTPTAAGPFNFTVQATDNTSGTVQTATAPFTITVDSPVVITTSALPGGAAGTAYTQTLSATGGTGPLTWSFTGTPPSWLSLTTGGVLSGTPPAAATYTFGVRASDSLGTADAKPFSIVVTGALNISITFLPAAVAGAPYSQTMVAAGGTPPYTWAEVPSLPAPPPGGVILNTGGNGKSRAAGPSAALPTGLTLSPGGVLSGTPTGAGTFTFTLAVQDSSTPPQSATTTFSFTVLPGLSITTPALANGQVGLPYTQTLTAAGGQGTYTWSILNGSVPGLSLSPAGVLAGIPTTPGTHTLSIRLGDGTGGSANASFTVLVTPAAMTITTASPLPAATAGLPYWATFSASGGIAPYTFSLEPGSALPPGLVLSAAGLLAGTPTAAGNYNFQVRASSGSTTLPVSAVKAFSLTVSATNLGITTTFLNSGVVNQTYSQQLLASGGSPPYTWSLLAGQLPTGMTLTGAGLLGGTPSSTAEISLTIRVADSAGQAATGSFFLTVTATPVPLQISTSVPDPGTVSVPYAFVFSATGGKPGYTFSLASGSGLPQGLTLLPSGTLTGTPTQAGDFGFTVGVSDTAGGSSTRAFSVTIRTTGLTISTLSAAGGSVGAPYSQSFAATGGTAPYTWNAAGGLPPGVSFSPTGVLSGSPTTAGTYDVIVNVRDAAGATASKTFSVVITGVGIAIGNASPLPEATVGQAYSLSFSATGGAAPYSWTVSGLPSGLAANASGSVTGTPLVDGTFSLSVTVADAQNNKGSKSFELTVKATPLVISTDANLGTVPAAVPVSRTFVATGGVPPYSWSVGAGNPAGLLMNAGGTLSGTPGAQGTFSFSVTVSDSRGTRDTREFTITVGSPPLAVGTASLPGGTAGAPYSASVTATGGTSPYRWSATSLPNGLSISPAGAIGGTPLAAGAFNVTVNVTDAAGQTATRVLALAIAVPPLPPATIAGPPDSAPPLTQPTIRLNIDAAYPVAIDGQLRLVFTPDRGGSDPTVQFATGGNLVRFTIPANTNLAQFTIPNMAFQTGSVAGVIVITATFSAAGVDITPRPAPSMTIRVAPSAPAIRTVVATRTGTGFSVTVTGFVTTREVTQAVFRFNAAPGSNLQTSEVTVPVQQLFVTWYGDPQSQVYGSQFTFTQTFNVQGDTSAIASVAVTLVNSLGNSQPVTATLQ